MKILLKLNATKFTSLTLIIMFIFQQKPSISDNEWAVRTIAKRVVTQFQQLFTRFEKMEFVYKNAREKDFDVTLKVVLQNVK